MPKTTLYFVRHGETDYNQKRIVQGRRINAGLNDTGRAQARAVAARFRDIPVDVLYSSTLRRAEETAECIAAFHPGISHIRLRDLEEISWGIYEGLPVTPEVLAALEKMNAHWTSGAFDYCVEDGESIYECQQRGLRAVKYILDHHAGQSVVVVTHGRFLRVLLASLLDEYGLARMNDIHHANTSVNHIIYENGTFRAEVLNCTDHLEFVETIEVE